VFRPTILENETIYSWLTRYHLKVGVGHPKNSYLTMLNCEKVRLHPYLPNHIGSLAMNTKTPPHFWINRHTLYPLFKFFGHDECGGLKSAMLDNKSNVMGQASIPQAKLSFEFGHRYCPECIRELKAQRGFGIFDIRYQIPGVLACPIHRCLLNVINCGDYGIDRTLTMSFFKKEYIKANTHHVDFALFCFDTFNLIQQGKVVIELTKLYRQHLKSQGYLTNNGQLKYKKIHNDISTYYRDFPFISGFETLKEFHYLGPLLRDKTHTHIHPTKHLVFTYWLFNGDAKLFNEPLLESNDECLSKLEANDIESVILTMLEQEKSMKSISQSTGKSRCYIKRRCELHGIKHQSNTQATDANKTHVVILQAQLGRHRKVIARNLKLGVGYVEQVISNTKGLVAWRKRLAVLTKIKIAYLELTSAKSIHPNWFRKDFKRLHNQAFFYMYHHAKGLLEKILPAKLKPHRATLDWEKEDERLSEAVSDIGNIADLSISAIGYKIKDSSHLRRHLNKLPKTKALLKERGKIK